MSLHQDPLAHQIADWILDTRGIRATHPSATRLTSDFLTGEQRNPNTRKAYCRILKALFVWLDRAEHPSLAELTTAHIGRYIDGLTPSYRKVHLSNRTKAQTLAALRSYFDCLVRGGALATNPAASVSNVRVRAKQGKAPILRPHEMRRLLDSIETGTLQGLQDRAVIALMFFTLARVGAALKMKHDAVYEEGGVLHVRLSEKRGAIHVMPCHPELEGCLRAYIARSSRPAPDCAPNPQGWLFRRWDRKHRRLDGTPLTYAACRAMVSRRAAKAGLKTRVTNHSFRASGITAFLDDGGTLEKAARMANHSSTTTTQLYDRRNHAVSRNDIERIKLPSQ